MKQGDWIIIEEPRLFIRCGYALTIENVDQEVRTLYQKELQPIKALLKIGGHNQPNGSRQFDVIVRELCYFYIRNNKFGGPERKIYESEPKEKYRNMCVQVEQIKTVVTGDYVRGSSPVFGTFQYEYDPPYLANQKRHTILSFWPRDTVSVGPLWITKKNVLTKEN